MNIDVVQHDSRELRQRIHLALPGDRTDVYLEQFRPSFPFPPDMTFLLDDTRGISHFVDVGANIGTVTICAAALGLECIAVEAEPRNYALLCQTVAANRFMNVYPVHLAASDAPGVVGFAGDSAWGSVVAEPGAGHPRGVSVPAAPLDDVLPLYGFGSPDLVKIDVEGHEAAVLRGLRATIRSSNPLLVVESNTWMLGGVASARKLLSMLERFRYHLFLFLRDGSVVRRPSSMLQPFAVADYLAIPQDRFHARALPPLRTLSFDDELALMHAEPLDSGPHVLHLCQIIASLEAAGRRSSRVAELRNRIATGDPEVLSFVRTHYPGPVPDWLQEPPFYTST
jgi:FkbM family methyltransferase